MEYKGDYQPSFIQCPLTYNWVLLDENSRSTIKQQLEIKSKKGKTDCRLSNQPLATEMQFENISTFIAENLKVSI